VRVYDPGKSLEYEKLAIFLIHFSGNGLEVLSKIMTNTDYISRLEFPEYGCLGASYVGDILLSLRNARMWLAQAAGRCLPSVETRGEMQGCLSGNVLIWCC
jgi:hypothetical protein